MRIQVNHEILAQKFNRTWQDHNGQSVIEFESQDAIYPLYPPRGELHLESGIWTVLIEQEYDRSASIPDFCAVRIYFDEEGKVASGAALYRQGDGRQLPGVVIDITSELLDCVGLPEVAVLIEFAGKVIDYILGNIGDWSERRAPQFHGRGRTRPRPRPQFARLRARSRLALRARRLQGAELVSRARQLRHGVDQNRQRSCLVGGNA